MFYNLFQSYDSSRILIRGGGTVAEESTVPSLTARGSSETHIESSDVSRLEIAAIENGTVRLDQCAGVDPSRYRTQGSGRILINGPPPAGSPDIRVLPNLAQPPPVRLNPRPG